MARAYVYTLKIIATRHVDQTKDEQSQTAMNTRKAVEKALTDAGFALTSTGVFGFKAE